MPVSGWHPGSIAPWQHPGHSLTPHKGWHPPHGVLGTQDCSLDAAGEALVADVASTAVSPLVLLEEGTHLVPGR